jgi:plastocyanin
VPCSSFVRLAFTHPARLTATAAAGLLLLTACGGAAASDNGAITMPSGQGAASMPAMPSATLAGSPQAAAAARGPNSIVIKDFTFSPAVMHVKPGTVVTWTNNDEEPHTVFGGPLKSGVLAGGQASYSFTFSKAGTFKYICSIHPFMHGSVVVG